MQSKIHFSLFALVMTMLCNLAWVGVSDAQLLPITTRVITINNLSVAALRHPTAPGPKAKIGIFIMHPDGSYVNNVACTQLAGRGYTTLCADSIFLRRGQDYYGYEQHAPGIASGINFLKNPANVDGIVIEKFIVWGHSVGAPLMAFYQNVAENGAAACQGPEKILPCDASTLNDLPVPDGVILADAHLGAALATFTYVDPAIKKENKPGIRTPTTNSSSASWKRRPTAMPTCCTKHKTYGQTSTPVRAKSTLTTCLSLFPAPMARLGCGRPIRVSSIARKTLRFF
jgi:hypothetical protein